MNRIVISKSKTEEPLWQRIKEQLAKEINDVPFGEKFYTIGEICERFNVSQITARRVLEEIEKDGLIETGRGRRSIVKKISEDISIEVIIPRGYTERTFQNPVVFKTYSGILDTAKELGVKVDFISEKYFNRDISIGEKRGFILLYGVKNSVCESLKKHNLPFVVLMDEDFPFPCVRVDKEYGAFIAVEHLILSGHKRIGCVLGPVNSIPFAPRFHGYCKALEENGIICDKALIKETSGIKEREDERAFEDLMSLKNPPTAIFAGNDYRAIHIMNYCKRKKIKIPEDISIVGFDNIRESLYTLPPLTTVDTHRDKTGREAVRQLVHILSAKEESPVYSILIKPTLVMRESVKIMNKTYILSKNSEGKRRER